jgi:hypothetical protein
VIKLNNSERIYRILSAITEGQLIQTFYSIGFGIEASAYGTLSNDRWQLKKITFAPVELERFETVDTKKIAFTISSKGLESIMTHYEIPITMGETKLSYGMAVLPTEGKFLVVRLLNGEVIFQVVFATDHDYLERQFGIPAPLIARVIKQITTKYGLTLLNKISPQSQILESV